MVSAYPVAYGNCSLRVSSGSHSVAPSSLANLLYSLSNYRASQLSISMFLCRSTEMVGLSNLLAAARIPLTCHVRLGSTNSFRSTRNFYTLVKLDMEDAVFFTIVDWVLIIFAVGSGVSKVIGIKVEKEGAQKFGIQYECVIVMGLLQLFSAVLIFFKLYLFVLFLFGVPYLYFVYVGAKFKDKVLAIFSFLAFSVVAFRWLASVVGM